MARSDGLRHLPMDDPEAIGLVEPVGLARQDVDHVLAVIQPRTLRSVLGLADLARQHLPSAATDLPEVDE